MKGRNLLVNTVLVLYFMLISCGEMFDEHYALEKKMADSLETEEGFIETVKMIGNALEKKVTGKCNVEIEINREKREAKTYMTFDFEESYIWLGSINFYFKGSYDNEELEFKEIADFDEVKTEDSLIFFVIGPYPRKDTLCGDSKEIFFKFIMGITEDKRRADLLDEVNTYYQAKYGDNYAISVEAFTGDLSFGDIKGSVAKIERAIEKWDGEVLNGVVYSQYSERAIVGIKTWSKNVYGEKMKIKRFRRYYKYQNGRWVLQKTSSGKKSFWGDLKKGFNNFMKGLGL